MNIQSRPLIFIWHYSQLPENRPTIIVFIPSKDHNSWQFHSDVAWEIYSLLVNKVEHWLICALPTAYMRGTLWQAVYIWQKNDIWTPGYKNKLLYYCSAITETNHHLIVCTIDDSFMLKPWRVSQCHFYSKINI